MPSSNWRLIRNGEGGISASSTTAIPPTPLATATDDGGAVFRGRQRAAAGRGVGTGQIAVPATADADAAPVLTPEEIEQLARAAEERGYEIGRARAESELRAAVAGASAIAEHLQSIAPERTSEIAHSIAELALSVAKRIVQHEVREEPSLLCAALETAVSTINGSPEARVLLHPSAVGPVAEAWEALHGRAYLGKKWTFEGDPTLPIGGCTVRYEHGFVEAGLEAQLEEIGIALDRAIPNIARGSLEEDVA